jgi:signal transduction histidine kinase
MAALSAQTTQASGRVPGGPLVGLSVGITVGRTSCDPAALAVENASLEAELRATTDELRRSRARIVTAAATERHRLERELHDGAQNRLVALQIRLGVSGVAVQILSSGIGSSTPEVELAVYLCCLEAMQNAAKHAGRDARVTVRLSRDEDELTFSVEDDGCGFEPASAEGSGRAGPEDRIVPLGGRLEVSSTRGHGKTVAGAVPWLRRTRNTALSAPAQPAVV